jgi:transcriptional regulator with XRE-family HTH domain
MQRRGAAPRWTAARQPNVDMFVPMASFGALLRTHREHALLSQEKLAERAGLSVRTVRELEAGRVRRPHGSSVRLLAQALGLRGNWRRVFEAAARPHPAAAQTGTAVHRGGEDPKSDPTVGGGVLLPLRPPPLEGCGCRNAFVLLPSSCHRLTSLRGAPPTWTIANSGLTLAGAQGDLGAPRVLLVVVPADPAVGRRKRCPTCGRREVG